MSPRREVWARLERVCVRVLAVTHDSRTLPDAFFPTGEALAALMVVDAGLGSLAAAVREAKARARRLRPGHRVERGVGRRCATRRAVWRHVHGWGRHRRGRVERTVGKGVRSFLVRRRLMACISANVSG